MSEQEKVIIVTGGSRGLGLGIVRDLLNEGYRVATCNRTVSNAVRALEEQYGSSHFFWQSCAIGNANDEDPFVSAVADWASPHTLHGLVNNAGIARDGILATFPNKATDEVIEVNLTGAIRMARLVIRVFLQQNNPGRVINISSIVGSRGYTGLAAYAASKAGLDGMTRALAREVGRRGITVNAIAPGFLETELSEALDTKQRDQIIRRTPLKRLGTVDDIVPVIRFLLSQEASFVTGQTWTVDGGLTC